MKIWDELVKAAKHKARNYPNRQNELAILCRTLEKIDEDIFDDLGPIATEWYNVAAEAINQQTELPEPNDVKTYATNPKLKKDVEKYLKENSEESSDDTGHEADEAASDAAAETDAGDSSDDEDDIDEEDLEGDEEVAEPEPPKEKSRPKAKKAKSEPEPEPDEPGDDDQDGSVDTPPAKKPKGPRPRKSRETPFDKLSGEKDRYGIYEGTNTSKAIQLYEKGSTVKQVTDILSGKYRNILKKLAEEGHLVEKLEGGIYKVTHRDDIPKGKKK